MSNWRKTSDCMPPAGVKVLAAYRNSHGHWRRICARYAPAKTFETDNEDWFEYDEETDTPYQPEGWYEIVDNWDEYSSSFVTEGEVTHWMPMPAPPEEQI